MKKSSPLQPFCCYAATLEVNDRQILSLPSRGLPIANPAETRTVPFVRYKLTVPNVWYNVNRSFLIAQMPKETYVPCLLHLFRQYGYDGATLAKISEATGLGKASLYHHFPGGKDEMVATVLEYLERWMDQNIVQRLKGTGDPLSRLQQMCDRLGEVYDGGKQPCLSAILLLGSARDVFHDRVQALYCAWIEAIANVLIESGMDKTLAQQRGEDAVITIQGALILSQGLNEPAPFRRVIQQLPAELLNSRVESSKKQVS